MRPSKNQRPAWTGALISFTLAFGCQSEQPTSTPLGAAGVSGASASSGSGGASAAGTGAGASSSEIATAEIAETNAKAISRLTAAQFLRSAASLMGDAALVGAAEKLTLREAWTGPAYSNAGFNQATGKHDIQDFDDAATYVVGHVADWPAFHARWGGCQQVTCINTFLTSFLEAAFRRPVTNADVTAFQPIIDASSAAALSYDETIQLVVRAVLQSFEFLYLPQSERLDDFQLAARVSYFIADGPPDAELYAAAKANQLHEPATLSQQVDRLLAANVGRFARAFGRDYFELNAALLRVGERSTQRGLIDSALDSLASLIEQKQPIDALMTTSSLTVNDATVAWLGLPAGGTSVSPSAQYPFLGLLTHPAVLMAISNEEKGSTISRGLAISEHFLCVAPPPNPPAGIQAKQSEFNLPPDATARAKAEARLSSPTCAGCHAVFEPFSFALNHWDGNGRYDADPKLNDNGPITTALGTIAFQDYREFFQKVSRSEQFQSCVSEHVIRYGLRHTTFTPELRQSVVAQAKASPGGLTFQSLIKALILEPIFAQR
jgi:hypothetical protein